MGDSLVFNACAVFLTVGFIFKDRLVLFFVFFLGVCFKSLVYALFRNVLRCSDFKMLNRKIGKGVILNM